MLAHGRTGGSVREKLRVGLSVMPWGYWWSYRVLTVLPESMPITGKNENWDERQPYILEQFFEVFVFSLFGTDPTCITESSTRATSSKQWTLGLNPRCTETQWCPQTVPMPNLVRETLHQVATVNSELFVQQVDNVYRFLHGIKSFGICFLSLPSPVQATRAGVGARGITVGTEHRE